MKTLLLTLVTGLLLVLLVGCGEPTPLEIAAKSDVVVPRARELMLTAIFSPDAECRELGGQFAEEYEVDAMPYDDAGAKDRIVQTGKFGKGPRRLRRGPREGRLPTLRLIGYEIPPGV